METVCFSKTLASTDESTRCQNPEENVIILTAMKTLYLTSVLTSKAVSFWNREHDKDQEMRLFRHE
jgi:hypothetical protein